MRDIKQLHVVLASPNDVKKERRLLVCAIEELNENLADRLGMHLRLRRWETDAYPGFDAKGLQGIIDRVLDIPRCDIFIAIFWRRFGTPTFDAASGTFHEYYEACKSWERRRRPHIMVYFSKQRLASIEAEGWEQMARGVVIPAVLATGSDVVGVQESIGF
jgi:hypothetical protein